MDTFVQAVSAEKHKSDVFEVFDIGLLMDADGVEAIED